MKSASPKQLIVLVLATAFFGWCVRGMTDDYKHGLPYELYLFPLTVALILVITNAIAIYKSISSST